MSWRLFFISRLTSLCFGFITGLVMGIRNRSLYRSVSPIDSVGVGTSVELVSTPLGCPAGPCSFFSSVQARWLTRNCDFNYCRPVAASWPMQISLAVWVLLPLHTVLMRMIERFDYKGIERNYLSCACCSWASLVLPVFLLLPLVVLCPICCWLCCKYQWFANVFDSCRTYASWSWICDLASLLRLWNVTFTILPLVLRQMLTVLWAAMFKVLVLQFLLCLEQMRLQTSKRTNGCLHKQLQSVSMTSYIIGLKRL